MSAKVLVLSSTWDPIHVCGWRRAVALVIKGRAEVVEHNGKMLSRGFPLPMVVRLLHHVFIPYRQLPPSRRNILLRDRHTCQYCGKRRADTIDHIMPRSRWGAHTWNNLVAACARCNTRKGDRTPAEAGMRLLTTPWRPVNRVDFELMNAPDEAYNCWSQYV